MPDSPGFRDLRDNNIVHFWCWYGVQQNITLQIFTCVEFTSQHIPPTGSTHKLLRPAQVKHGLSHFDAMPDASQSTRAVLYDNCKSNSKHAVSWRQDFQAASDIWLFWIHFGTFWALLESTWLFSTSPWLPWCPLGCHACRMHCPAETFFYFPWALYPFWGVGEGTEAYPSCIWAGGTVEGFASSSRVLCD